MSATSPLSLQIDWIEGFCPMQAEGALGGRRFDFRARGNRWTFSLRPAEGAAEWKYAQPYGEEMFDAGVMEEDEVRGFILEAASAFAALSGRAVSLGGATLH